MSVTLYPSRHIDNLRVELELVALALMTMPEETEEVTAEVERVDEV